MGPILFLFCFYYFSIFGPISMFSRNPIVTSNMNFIRLPVVTLIEGSADRRQACRRVFGSRRAKTLRNRARAFKRYRTWLETVRGRSWPARVSDVTDYLEERAKDGCGFSVPGDLLAAFSVLESVGRVPLKDRFSADETVRAVVQSIAEELQSRAAPRRPAKLYTVAMLLALEIRVMDLLAPLFSRVIAWVMLLQHWAAMRADDVQWLDPGRITLSASGLAGVLRRTKTTGPGRRAREVPIYVSREVSLSGNDWLQEGENLFWREEIYWERMYFLPFPSSDWESGAKKHLSPEMLNVCIKRVLSELSLPARGERHWRKSDVSLLPHELLPFGLDTRQGTGFLPGQQCWVCRSLIGIFWEGGKPGPTRVMSTSLLRGKWYTECRCMWSRRSIVVIKVWTSSPC